MQRLDLYFEHYANKVTKADDYFDLIIKKLKKDEFTIQTSRSAEYVYVDVDDISSYEEKGVTIFDKEGRDFVHISTLCVSFFGVSAEDYPEVRKELVKFYGEKSCRAEFVDTLVVEDGELIN